MKFQFKMNLKGRHGAPVSFMIGEVYKDAGLSTKVGDIGELAELMNDERFVVINRFHEERSGELRQLGPEVIATRRIATSKEYKERHHREIETVGGED